MTSSYYSSIGRQIDMPILSDGEDLMKDPNLSEEVDLTESVNKEIDRLQLDHNRQLTFLGEQYNHLHRVEADKTKDFLQVLKTGVSLKQSYDAYEQKIRPYREWINQQGELQKS